MDNNTGVRIAMPARPYLRTILIISLLRRVNLLAGINFGTLMFSNP